MVVAPYVRVSELARRWETSPFSVHTLLRHRHPDVLRRIGHCWFVDVAALRRALPELGANLLVPLPKSSERDVAAE